MAEQPEELKAKLSQLEKEVETKKRSGDLIFKVGEKGGVSVYGLGRFPVTLCSTMEPPPGRRHRNQGLFSKKTSRSSTSKTKDDTRQRASIPSKGSNLEGALS